MATRKSIYVPFEQIPIRGMFITVRTSGDPLSLAQPVRNQVRELDADQPVARVKPMSEVISTSIWQPRLYAILFALFAVLALILASVGIYGVMSYAVTQRTHEIGIRMALGAQTRDVLKHGRRAGNAAHARQVSRSACWSAFVTDARDGEPAVRRERDRPLTFIGVSLLLGVVALFACFIPARRATRVDPMTALRYE